MKLATVKRVVGIVAGAGTGFVIGNAIKATSPQDMGAIGKIATSIGGFVMGGIVGNAAGKYTDEAIDDVVEFVDDLKTS